MKPLRSVERLTDCFNKLPGIGTKTAERLALSILDFSDEDANEFSEAILAVKNTIHKCPICGMYTQDDFCEICSDESRTNDLVIVVSRPKDIFAFEKIGKFNGKYHVLGGVLSASAGVSPSDLRIDELLERIDKDNIKEIIVATDPTIEGEMTALYISKLLEGKAISVTRLAYGLPMGGHLDYADVLTLDRALEGRRKI